ncbi:MAG: MBOAT family protein [Clostridiales Family XIII bacterium]|jgi:D-alanyl-lipoteichoic acid acyltransferase DltB (MBOAT superfamily)|nr:MBOAT family protein [Clostridiales Family XIII bacterium]
MYFTSSAFVLFLVVVLTGYYVSPGRFRPVWLLFANSFFCVASGWAGTACVAATCLTTWYAGKRMDRLSKSLAARLADADLVSSEAKALRRRTKEQKRLWLLLGVCVNVGILAVTKYSGFFAQNLNAMARVLGLSFTASGFDFALTLGISFYTFKALSYMTDLYRGKKTEAAGSLVQVALFVSFFPELVQGPISRYCDLSPGLFAGRIPCRDEFCAGVQRILFGFFKKLVVADRLLPAVVILTKSPDEFKGAYVLLTMWFYAVVLFADFTGGIDIAVGVAKLFGIDVTENFNRPFYSKSIAEYWRRWHITMGAWFKDYLFYPLSASSAMLKLIKPSKRIFGKGVGVRIPVYIVTTVLWFTTGLWHGASWNFIVWGLTNGAIIIVSQELSPLYKRFHARFAFSETPVYGAFQIVRTFCLMSFIRVFDIYAGVGVTLGAYASVFADFGREGFAARSVLDLGLSVSDCVVVALGVCVMISAGLWTRRAAYKGTSLTARVCLCFLLFLATTVFGCYGIGYDAKQFIYNRF